VADDAQEIIGFAGIGLMGRPIAARLVEAGYEVLVWNRTPGRCEALVQLGAEEVETPADLAEHCDVILLCLADAAAVEAVVFGEDGIAGAASDDQLLIDLSSIPPENARDFARELEQACGAGWIDAPVSGGPLRAGDGTLIVLAGGQAEDIERARPVLESFSRRITHVGASGAGQLAKVCNQMIVCNTALVIAEMIALAERAGIDAERLPEALKGGLADSALLQGLAPRMAVRQYEPPLARLATLQKDLDTIVDVARAADAPAPVSALSAQLVRRHRLAHGNEADTTTLIELFAAE
jgi:3-hydroxyisobutyrate dehydrogenase